MYHEYTQCNGGGSWTSGFPHVQVDSLDKTGHSVLHPVYLDPSSLIPQPVLLPPKDGVRKLQEHANFIQRFLVMVYGETW